MNTYHPGDSPVQTEKDDIRNDLEPEHFLQQANLTHRNDSNDDVFGQEEGHDIKYKTLSWQAVAMLMITDVVSNGTLSLPSSLAVIGIVPAVLIIFALGVLATYTAWILIEFKLRHPQGESR